MTQIRNGAIAGIAGGIVFGMLMAMMGMLTMIAGMVGSSSPVIGFLVHLMISAIIGAGFGITLNQFAVSKARSTTAGLLYGAFWWLLGPLTLMPLMMGMGFGSQWSVAAARSALPSLMGHLIYGGILGFTYFLLAGRKESEPRVQHA